MVFDTTLRDGEQSPGAALNINEKVEIAHALTEMGVDVIEAGFAIASQGDFDAVKAIAESIKDSTICSLARALDNVPADATGQLVELTRKKWIVVGSVLAAVGLILGVAGVVYVASTIPGVARLFHDTAATVYRLDGRPS